MPESDLYVPLKCAFQAQGYTVFGEVNCCDLVARRGDELLIVEMKRAFNLELVFQGLDRQRVSPNVCLAIEAPRRMERKRRRGMLRLCRRLGLGLIAVHQRQGMAEVWLQPAPRDLRTDRRRKRQLLSEIDRRSGDFNTGGCTGQKIVTAYREEALRIARQLKLNGPSKVRNLAKDAESTKAGSILLNNYYGWFERVNRGVYKLTEQGTAALETYARVLS